jgi:HEAT repeat protein
MKTPGKRGASPKKAAVTSAVRSMAAKEYERETGPDLDSLQGLDRGALPALTAMLKDAREVPLARNLAALALGRIGEPAAPALIEAARHRDADTRRWAVLGLAAVPLTDSVAEAFLRAAKDEDPNVRHSAIIALSSFSPPPAALIPARARVLEDPNNVLRELAIARLTNSA